MNGPAFSILSGLWALAMVAVLISAIRLSYRIEKRSEGLRNTSGIPQKAQFFHTISNWKVERDSETQALRRKMLARLLIVAAGMAVFAVAVFTVRAL